MVTHISEIIEVPIGLVNGINQSFRTSRAFFPGTVSIYINGLLRVNAADDGVLEIDPVIGLIQLKIIPEIPDSVQVSYQDASFKSLFNDESIPINIKDLASGAQLRISMKAGMQLEPMFDKTMHTPNKHRMARSYSRTTFFAYLMSNDPQNGRMIVNIQEINTSLPNYYVATVEYKNILRIQRVVSRGRPVVETAPKNHPGAQALGTKMAQLYQQPYLVPVLFCGG